MSKYSTIINEVNYDWKFKDVKHPDIKQYNFILGPHIMGQIYKMWDGSWSACVSGDMQDNAGRLVNKLSTRHSAVDYILQMHELTRFGIHK